MVQQVGLFSVVLFPIIPIQAVVSIKKIFGHTGRFQGRVGGLNQKRHFDVLRDKFGMGVAPQESIHYLEKVQSKLQYHVTISSIAYLAYFLNLLITRKILNDNSENASFGTPVSDNFKFCGSHLTLMVQLNHRQIQKFHLLYILKQSENS